MKHTPTPLTLEQYTGHPHYEIYAKFDYGPQRIAYMQDHMHDAQKIGEEIVQACNAYDRLVEFRIKVCEALSCSPDADVDLVIRKVAAIREDRKDLAKRNDHLVSENERLREALKACLSYLEACAYAPEHDRMIEKAREALGGEK